MRRCPLCLSLGILFVPPAIGAQETAAYFPSERYPLEVTDQRGDTTAITDSDCDIFGSSARVKWMKATVPIDSAGDLVMAFVFENVGLVADTEGRLICRRRGTSGAAKLRGYLEIEGPRRDSIIAAVESNRAARRAEFVAREDSIRKASEAEQARVRAQRQARQARQRAEREAQERAQAEAEAQLERERAQRIRAKWPGYAETIIARQIRIGFTDEMVLEAWGPPDRKNRSVYSWGVQEQWVYEGYPQYYLYFADGVLKSYQESQ